MKATEDLLSKTVKSHLSDDFVLKSILPSKEILKEIFLVAAKAPSGHNFQPWQVEVSADRKSLAVSLVPGSDQTPYNYKESGSYIAIGTFLKNFEVAANNFDYQVRFSFFPDPQNDFLVTKVFFCYSDSLKSDEVNRLYKAALARATNRRIYENSLDKNSREALLNYISEFNLLFVENFNLRQKISRYLALPDRLMFENKIMHGSIFDHLVWTKEEEISKRKGLYLETMELPGPVKALFKVFKFWPIASILGKIGFGRVVQNDNGANYASAPIFVFIPLKQNNFFGFVELGYNLEALWLKAVTLGLSGQVFGGLPFLFRYIKEIKDQDVFSTKHVSEIIWSATEMNKVFGIKEDSVGLVLRLGFAKSPSAWSSRTEIPLGFVE